MKNKAASIRARLLNLSKQEGKAFQFISQLYMQERFLFRLSNSKYYNNFILKGGLLLYTIENFKGRSTKDIDLLGNNISNTNDSVIAAIKEITLIKSDDGLVFDSSSVRIEVITPNVEYQGTRIKIKCSLDTVKNFIQIDIGFGDIVHPKSINFDYPTLLEDKTFKVYAYSIESVIAEKFEAIISLAELNSRLKDFYDLYIIFQKKKINTDTLFEAIQKTFNRRKTIINPNHSFINPKYWNDERIIKQWNDFLTRIKSPQIDFQEVKNILWTKLIPIIEILKAE